jgi:hypothetical protein
MSGITLTAPQQNMGRLGRHLIAYLCPISEWKLIQFKTIRR